MPATKAGASARGCRPTTRSRWWNSSKHSERTHGDFHGSWATLLCEEEARVLARRADRGRRDPRLYRLVQVLSRGTAARLGDGIGGHALQVWLDRRGVRRRHPLLDLLRVTAHVPRKAARTGRLRPPRRALGAGPGTAGRIHQEDHRLSARRQYLRGLSYGDLSH